MLKKSLTILITSVLILMLSSCSSSDLSEQSDAQMRIWFNHPTYNWNEGLPIGNGRLGAMMYGNAKKEIITLNEETIWSGAKDYNADRKDGYKYIGKVQDFIFEGNYAEANKLVHEKVLSERLPSGTCAYQMLGKLLIEREGFGDITNFETGLDINKALVNTSFDKDGVTFSREMFSSATEQAIVVKYTASESGVINFAASVNRTDDTQVDYSENKIVFSEHVGGYGVRYHAVIDVETVNGTTCVKDGKLQVKGADEVILRIVAASDYRKTDPKVLCDDYLKQAKSYAYDELKDRHVADYKTLFDRVVLSISDVENDTIPTDVRLKQVKAGEADNYLTQVQYAFGRYLLISSSRPGTLPANLQGIWVNGIKPPWNSDYHININMQMNYWPAEMTNLSECHEPMLDFVGNLREMGRITAKETYGCRGFVAHHTSDVWYMTRAFGKAQYGMWPVGGAWCCQHLFTHYEYTEDKAYLEDYAYPVMREAALFFVDFMVEDPRIGKLVSGPSTSPENRFRTKEGQESTMNMGPTMDRAIIFELFTNCIKSAEILGIDAEFAQTLKEKMAQMPPLEIGSDGRLMEWTEEFEEPMPGHRHISHLYALHPSNQISKEKTPELFAAAKKTIEYRLSHGGGHTGWSRAWIINFWARLLDSEKAYENIIALQTKSTLPNLLDLHPPFQIDGNFGVVSGITEMLMQSHDQEINILPALPSAWATGHVSGIVARGGFELDLAWEEGILTSLKVRSRLGNPLKVRYGKHLVEMNTVTGKEIVFDTQLNLK